MTPMYEYVPRSEYAPVRREIEEIIKCAQIELRKQCHLTFQFQLIGSGRKHLITRIKDGNTGYDFDYNLILPRKPDCSLAELKQQFMNAFRKAIRGSGYKFPQDSTSAITIRKVDKSHSKRFHSVDFAVIYYETGGYYYIRNNKPQQCYEFAFRSITMDIQERVKAIIQQGQWNAIRDNYLKLKCNNRDKGKHSFSLYIEAVNNVYNSIFLQRHSAAKK